jgi:undecaprenyl-diphosphatase
MTNLIEWFSNSGAMFMPYGVWGLALIAFAESSFFPVPPDFVLIPLAILKPEWALWYALVATIASVLGGLFGYQIGVRAGRPLLAKLIAKERLNQVDALFAKYGGWAVIIAGVTPIPYKVFTIASGVSRLNRSTFIVASTIGRGTRFFLEGLAITLLGAGAKPLLVKYFEPLTLGLTVLVVGGYLLLGFTKRDSGINRLALNINAKIRTLIEVKLGPLGEFGNYLVAGIILAAFALLLFSKLAEDLIYQELNLFDSLVIGFITAYRTPLTTQAMKLISNFGSVTVLLSVTLLTFYVFYQRKKHFWDSLMVLIALGGGWLLNDVLKVAFHRPRPELVHLVQVSGYSFPSGHAMISVAFYGFLAYLIWLNYRPSPLRTLASLGLLGLAVLIGLSRIYLGVHYPSDVLAGFAAGGFWLISCILALQAIRFYKAKAI